MSFGQKPTAWARPQGAPQQQQINPNLFTNQLGLAATGQAFSAIPGMSLNSGLAGLVNQAAFTNTMNMSTMNSMLAQAHRSQMMPPQQHIQQQPQHQAVQQQHQQATSPTRSQRTFIGVVTKLMETYGFVDEDVFFQTNVIRGSLPRVGDRVMVEANYNPSMPFKWNAYRIQLIQDSAQGQQQPSRQPQQQQQNGANVQSRWSDRVVVRDDQPRRLQMAIPRRSSPPPPKEAKRPASDARQRSPQPRRTSPRKRDASPPRREPPAKRERDERQPERDRGESSLRGRSPQSKRDTASPPRRRQRIIPRYHCALPKQTLPTGELKCADLRRRYTNLYIPSDFIRCDFQWTRSVRLEQPIKFSPHPILFHVLHKDVDVPLGDGEEMPPESPPDADFQFVVKVLLVSHPGLSVLRQKLSGLCPDGSIDESTETQALAKNVQLLVGHKGKGEFMCIGGAWSPSLDGPNPADSQTMVKTAVRTTRALTGLDLSACAKWYKMLQLRYYRLERQRVDQVVLLLPDTSAVPAFKPSEEGHAAEAEKLREQLVAKLAALEAEVFLAPEEENKQNENAGIGISSDGSSSKQLSAVEGANSGQPVPQEKQQPTMMESSGGTAETVGGSSTGPEAMDAQSQGEGDQQQKDTETATGEDQAVSATQPAAKKDTKTHWTLLEPNLRAMKVAELREELELRSLDPKGVKNVLMQRLADAIEKEKATEPAPPEGDVPKEPAQEAQAVPAPTVDEQAKEKPEEAGNKAGEEKGKLSIVAEIKEEIIELMETDQVSEKESAEEKAAREKAEKEQRELEKAKEKFEKEKKERKAALERHYGLIPKEPPGIFVYPSKTAKSGKFDLKLVSLASLLDYRQEDSKEASFEVFLFAEALKETLDRGQAFIVYHSVATALDKDAEKKRRNDALTEACKDDEVVVLDEGILTGKKEDGGKGGTDKQAPKSPTNTIDVSTNFKALVNNLDVFTAFAHFDANICGYLADRDLEEVIHSVGLDLSRGEVQRLVKKLSSKERVNYRNLTDKWVDKEGVCKYVAVPTCDNLVQSYAEHAKGHSAQIGMEGVQEAAQGSQDSPVCMFKGSLVNVKQCLEQQEMMEQERQALSDKTEQLEMSLKSTKDQREQLEKKKRRLEDDLDRYKKKLHDTEKGLKKEVEEGAGVRKALQECKRYGERILGAVNSAMPPPPKPKEVEKEKPKEKGEQPAANAEIVLVDEAGTNAGEKPTGNGEEKQANGEEKQKKGEEKPKEGTGTEEKPKEGTGTEEKQPQGQEEPKKPTVDLSAAFTTPEDGPNAE